MRILIAGSVNDYSCYEEEQLTASLAAELKNMGHTVDYILLPYKAEALSLPDQILAYRMLDVSTVELLITIGYPACFLSHPNKISYLLETAPMLHEYWDSEYGILGNYQYSQILIRLNDIEAQSFAQAKKVFCGSRLLAEDLNRRYGFTAEYQPLPLLSAKEISGEQPAEGVRYFVTETCLLQNSRYYEFLEQLARNKDMNMYFFVPNADLVYSDSLTERISELRLEDRVKVIAGEPSDSFLIKSAGYLHFPCQSRRPESSLNRCAGLGVRIFMAEDCGAGAELSEFGASITKAPFDKLCNSLSSSTKSGRSEAIASVKEFAQRVVSI